MNFQLSLEKKINKFGQKAKILQKNENADEIRKKGPVYVRALIRKKQTFSQSRLPATSIQKRIKGSSKTDTIRGQVHIMNLNPVRFVAKDPPQKKNY